VHHNRPSELEEAINLGSDQKTSVLPTYALSTQVNLPAGAPVARDALTEKLVQSLRSAQPRETTYSTGQAEPTGLLLLSGGGQWGAYGAAFLRTLSDSGRLPDFPVISGVSTGALQSLFVATGHFDRMTTRYDPKSESVIIDRNPDVLTFITGSMAGLKPLEKLVEQDLCADTQEGHERCMLDELADLQRRNRHVFIGFVHAKDGEFQYIDVVEVANDRRMSTLERRQCIVGAALASAGMPVNFQQIQINHQTYYDGGVRLSVFDSDLVRHAYQAAQALTAASTPPGLQSIVPANPQELWRIYVIRNGRTVVQEPETDPDSKHDAITAALRADNIVTNQLEVESIAALRLQHPTLPISMTSANGIRCDRPAKSMFDPTFMRCLQCLGWRRGSAPDPWTALPELPMGTAQPNEEELPGKECVMGSKAPWQPTRD
jgi:hypothetical protein